MLSDSILDNPPTPVWLKRDLEEYFLSVDAVLETEQGGARITDGFGAGSFETYIPTILAAGSSIAILFGGTNDAGNNGDNATFSADYLGLLESLLIGPGASVDYVVCCTILTRNNAAPAARFTAEVDGCNARIAALPANFDAANPSFAGRAILADTFTSIGGHSAPASYFADGIHLVPYDEGMRLVIQCIADTIASEVTP